MNCARSNCDVALSHMTLTISNVSDTWTIWASGTVARHVTSQRPPSQTSVNSVWQCTSHLDSRRETAHL